MKLSVYDGQITFNVNYRSHGNDIAARRLTKAIINAHPDLEPVDVAASALMAQVMSTTMRIDFDLKPDASDHLTAFQKFWDWYWNHIALIKPSPLPGMEGIDIAYAVVADEALLGTVWDVFMELVPMTLQDVWYDQYIKAQNPYPAADELKPLSAVPKEKAADPAFLAQGSPPGSPSGSGATNTPSPEASDPPR